VATDKPLPRPYQLAALEQVVLRNTIVNMETGLGKTLVAVLAADHFLKTDPSRKVVFCATTVQLVKQQAAFIQRNSITDGLRVVDLTEGKVQYKAEWWSDLLLRCDVIVGIAAVLKRAMVDCGYIKAASVSLVVLDECHHAIGDDPFVSIIQEGVQDVGARPRVLGLTASYLHGRCKDLLDRRARLERTLKSSIWCPDPAHTRPFVTEQTFSSVQFGDGGDEHSTLRNICSSELRSLVALLLAGPLREYLKDLSNHQEKAARIFGQSGIWGWEAYVAKLLSVCSERLDPGMLASQLNAAGQRWAGLAETREREEACSGKLCALLSLIEHFAEESAGRYRCLVFVEQVIDAHPLAHAINICFGSQLALHISGTSTMSQSVQRSHLEAFKEGRVSILVATQAMEEGIDVPTCNYVVRYDVFTNVKSHVQGAGRARMKDAHIFYFENDPEVEQRFAQLMQQAARTDSVLPLEEPDTGTPRTYKHPGTQAQVDAYNCLSILYDYAQKSMRGQWPQLFERSSDESSCCIDACHLPTPNGLLTISAQRVSKFWAGDFGEDTFLKNLDIQRTARWSPKDTAEHRFAFVAVLRLIKVGCIQDDNMPSPDALANCVANNKAVFLADEDGAPRLRVVFGSRVDLDPVASGSHNEADNGMLVGSGACLDMDAQQHEPQPPLDASVAAATQFFQPELRSTTEPTMPCNLASPPADVQQQQQEQQPPPPPLPPPPPPPPQQQQQQQEQQLQQQQEEEEQQQQQQQQQQQEQQQELQQPFRAQSSPLLEPPLHMQSPPRLRIQAQSPSQLPRPPPQPQVPPQLPAQSPWQQPHPPGSGPDGWMPRRAPQSGAVPR